MLTRSAPGFARSLLLALGFALCLPASAQPVPLPLDGAALDSALARLGVVVQPDTQVQPVPQAQPVLQAQPVPPASAQTPAPAAPPAQEAPSAANAVPDAVPDDSLLAEIAALRAAVVGLAARNDSLATALAGREGRVDTVIVRDTTAARVAQRTVERVGEEATRAVQSFVPKLLLSLLLVLVAFYIVRGIAWVLEHLAARSAERRLFYKKLIPIARLLVWSLAVYLVIAAIFQVDSTSLLTAAAAIGVAIGFAAQDVLKNIFGGIIIILDQPFQVGDKVAVGETYGEVVSIGLRSTRITTPDDSLVTVPNAQVVDGQVSNANAGALDCQVVTHLYLPGWADVALAKRLAYEAAASSKYVYLNKPIVVNVLDEFKETFLLHLKVKAYVLDTRYEHLLASDVTEAAKTAFLRHGLLYPMTAAHDPFDGFVPERGVPEEEAEPSGAA